ncbi:MAG TPA: 2-oxo-4-hydroxy-4-carboxy-5-ureidoimidazoline decarboxylase [Chitinophagaceae bacterium]|nr:2-oxo-4-hydroxy-4-carboxy-5-ureidoimidazoline decarboxylase [Chitinophagaceae bacterium]
MTLHELNTLPQQQLKEELIKCCGSSAWVNKMVPFFPAEDLVEVLEDAEEQWFLCSDADWKEAFAQHPRIGDIGPLQKKFTSTTEWAAREQSGIATASQQTLEALAEANKKYEQKFGYIFIVYATGKSADELLTLLETRLQNSPEVEIEIAADEQNKITKLRIEKLLE